MSLYTTYTPEQAIHLIRFIVIWVVAFFAVMGWLWWRGRNERKQYGS